MASLNQQHKDEITQLVKDQYFKSKIDLAIGIAPDEINENVFYIYLKKTDIYRGVTLFIYKHNEPALHSYLSQIYADNHEKLVEIPPTGPPLPKDYSPPPPDPHSGAFLDEKTQLLHSLAAAHDVRI